jgi:small subunit ribosomal protein S16e
MRRRPPCTRLTWQLFVALAVFADLQRNAVAVAFVKAGKGVLRVNGVPLHLVEPEPLRAKVLEPVLLLGADRFNGLDVRVRVRGGGYSSQVYGEQPWLRMLVMVYLDRRVLHPCIGA